MDNCNENRTHKTSKVAFYGNEVETEILQIEDICGIEVEVGTNGYMGGDAGHGCTTYLRLTNICDTCMDCETGQQGRDVSILMRGDCELKNFIEALEFAVETLRKQEYGVLPQSVQTAQQEAFTRYLSDLLESYQKTQTLHGIGLLSEKHHVTCLTKEKFYKCRLDKVADKRDLVIADKEYCNKVYEYALKHTDTPPIFNSI